MGLIDWGKLKPSHELKAHLQALKELPRNEYMERMYDKVSRGRGRDRDNCPRPTGVMIEEGPAGHLSFERKVFPGRPVLQWPDGKQTHLPIVQKTQEQERFWGPQDEDEHQGIRLLLVADGETVDGEAEAAEVRVAENPGGSDLSPGPVAHQGL